MLPDQRTILSVKDSDSDLRNRVNVSTIVNQRKTRTRRRPGCRDQSRADSVIRRGVGLLYSFVICSRGASRRSRWAMARTVSSRSAACYETGPGQWVRSPRCRERRRSGRRQIEPALCRNFLHTLHCVSATPAAPAELNGGDGGPSQGRPDR